MDQWRETVTVYHANSRSELFAHVIYCRPINCRKGLTAAKIPDKNELETSWISHVITGSIEQSDHVDVKHKGKLPGQWTKDLPLSGLHNND